MTEERTGGGEMTLHSDEPEPVSPRAHVDPAIVQLPTGVLVAGYSPRADGHVEEHARLLAESDRPLPPILVQRFTMRVVDGLHRVRAAVLRGEDTIAARFFDGDDAEAFVVAVRANIGHGLPLTFHDRAAAVRRLLSLFPQHSDRWLADTAGLAPATVASIRARFAPDPGDTATRVGRDGKVRPLSSAPARMAASEIIASRPDVSLREVARLTGLSPATVHDVRQRLQRGDDPVPERTRRVRRTSRARAQVAGPHDEVRDPDELLQLLSRDPALRLNDAGRVALRWLVAHGSGLQTWQDALGALPPHCVYLVAELATACAGEWSRLGASLMQRIEGTA